MARQFIITWADDADDVDIDYMREAIDQCDGDYSVTDTTY